MGWLHHQRLLSHVAFVLLRDRAGVAQLVIEDEPTRSQLAELRPETVLSVVGTAVASSQAPAGVELHDVTLDAISAPVADPPIELRRPSLKEHLPTILDNAAVALRHPKVRARWRLAAASMAGFRSALDDRGFTEIQTPKLVSSATEGGANVLAVDYFGRPAYLAQSPQFYKQTMVGVFERVYEVGPVFRAEPHDTARHLAEYVSLDAEMGLHRRPPRPDGSAARRAGVDDGRDRRARARSARAARARAAQGPRRHPEVDFVEAQQMIESATGERVLGEPDLAPAHERWIGEWAQREHGSDFVFVTGYPMANRPFYTHPCPDRPAQSNSFDLIFRGIELVTGGQRLHRYDDYLAALAERSIDPAPFRSYLDASRYGLSPHGGFAIGLERCVARITGASNVREVALLPRDVNRLAP